MQHEDTNQKIFCSMAEVFQSAQTTYAGHRKNIAILKKIQDKAVANNFDDSFNYWFNKFVLKILPLKKSEVIGDRIIKLVAAFIASLDKELTILKENAELLDQYQSKEKMVNKFIDGFIRYLLRGIESRDKHVRFRVMQLLVMIMDNLGEIDEELYNLLMWSLKKRIFDKEPSIRTQAVFCLTKFQDDTGFDTNNSTSNDEEENDATQQLLSIIQNDPSADVRRAAMLNLVITPKTISYILERAHDVNPINRRLVYSRTLKKLGLDCFSKLESKILNQLIKWGLEDRDDSVRTACERLIAYHWINLFNGDLIELLENLNIVKFDETFYNAIMKLLHLRDDIIPMLKFPQDIWSRLTIETVFLFRCLYSHCIKNELYDVIDRIFPEASLLAKHIQFYLNKRFHSIEPLSKVDMKHLDFILNQLLCTANYYDFTDEIGRRSILVIIRNMLSIKSLPEKLIRIGHKVLKKLSINERDFVTMAIEIINDLRDEDIEIQEQEEQTKIGEKNKSNREDNDEDDEDMRSFHEEVEKLVNSDQATTNDSGSNSMSKLDGEKEARPETIAICLARSSCMLELVNDPLEQNVLIMSLIDTLITPAVRNTEPKIRELGVRNLGLCCLLDVQLAIENMYILGMCVSKGNESLKIIALQSIVDIFSIHGNVVVDGEGKVDSISLHKIFYKVLKNENLPECQAIAAEGLCKLYLADIFTDDDLFEALVLSYFSPSNSSDEPLIQAFAFCIPVYCFSHISHQAKMVKIAADVLLRLCTLWSDLQDSLDPKADVTTMLKPKIILQQLIHWTDPRKLVNPNLTSKKLDVNFSRDNIQLNFLIDLLNVVPQIEKRDIKRAILNTLNLFYIDPCQDFQLLEKISESIDDLLENENMDKPCQNSLNRFKVTLLQCIEESRKINEDKLARSENETNDDFDITNEEISQLLESNSVEASDANLDTDDPGDSVRNITINGNISSADSSANDLGAVSNKKRKRTDMEDGIASNIQDSNENDMTLNKSKNVSFILPDEERSVHNTDDGVIDKNNIDKDIEMED